MTKAITAPEFDPKKEAQEHKLFIEQYLNIKLDDYRDFLQLKTVYALCLSHQSGERLPRTRKIRSDHYFGIVRFMAVATLYTDCANNMIVAGKKKDGRYQKAIADNNFLMLKLDVVKSTLDELIATVKRLGWYISNTRYRYESYNNEKHYKGKPSIKRVFIGFYDLFGMGKKMRDAIKRAVAFNQRSSKKGENNSLSKMLEGEFHKFGYGKENERRFLERKAKREVNKAAAKQHGAFSPTNQKNHSELVAEQIELQRKGYSSKQIAAHQSGEAPIFDDIPF
ncbi:hypothetical protein G6Z94_11675 [Vibrio aestuarianus]|uniref:hypothetical protein n=1 Tax=Vibrio aestuarianus TaxID=28171 RepID=UPI0015932985|nr:hypothetical protein [Vibrio aestuarianus]NGZ17998.1 hypothetical protein [Vibrio aestuarianus]